MDERGDEEVDGKAQRDEVTRDHTGVNRAGGMYESPVHRGSMSLK
jgi:hypothetical protein